MNIIYAADFGIVPGHHTDYPARIAALVRSLAPRTTVKFAPGLYDFLGGAQTVHRRVSNSEQAAQLKAAVLLQNCRDITLDWQGAVLLFHEDLSPFMLLECRNISIENLSFDWAVPLSAEGTVVHSNHEFVDVMIDSALYPYTVRNGKLLFLRENEKPAALFAALEFDASTLQVRAGAGDTFPRVSASLQSAGLVRLTGDFKVPPLVGNVLVLRHGARIHPGLLADNCTHIQLSHIHVRNTGGLGMLFQFCEHIDICRVVFAPALDSGRKVLSGHDDGLHFSNCRGKIRVENCEFRGLMDDPINIHGTSVRVLEKLSDTVLRCAFIHPQSYGFSNWAQSSDEIAFLEHKTLAELGTAKAVSYQFCENSEKEFTIEFSGPIPSALCPGDALENLSNTPALVCRYNHFGSCRARGLLVSTPKPVLIEHNLFESSGSAILLAGDANEWYESGACHDVTIRNNTFANCCTSEYQFCYGVISIAPEIPYRSQNQKFHTNIKITGNTFLANDRALLYAHCCGNLVFRGNVVFLSSRFYSTPFTNIRDCSCPVIERNEFTGTVLSLEKVRALFNSSGR